jgi:hypothetical protein
MGLVMGVTRFAVVLILSLLALQAPAACEDDDLRVDESPGQEDSGVEGWYFREAYVYPLALTYEPVVLYLDGDYVEVADEPVEEMDEAADRRERPEAWGTWRKDGSTYYLTDHEGNTEDYQMGSERWYPAHPYLPDVPLAAAYVNSTGGDYGNGTHALFQTRIDFPQEGYFHHSSDNSVITPGSTGWNTTEDAGTYTVADHTMVLTYNSGQEERLSFALGAEGDPSQPSSDIIFIGGDVFVADDPPA